MAAPGWSHATAAVCLHATATTLYSVLHSHLHIFLLPTDTLDSFPAPHPLRLGHPSHPSMPSCRISEDSLDAVVIQGLQSGSAAMANYALRTLLWPVTYRQGVGTGEGRGWGRANGKRAGGSSRGESGGGREVGEGQQRGCGPGHVSGNCKLARWTSMVSRWDKGGGVQAQQSSRQQAPPPHT